MIRFQSYVYLALGLALADLPLAPIMQANKFDPVSQGSSKGLDPYPFSPEVTRKKSIASFTISPYYQTAKKSVNGAGKDSFISSGSTAVNYGVGEERGLFNIAGLYYGMADIRMRETSTGSGAGNGEGNYSKALYYAPMGMTLHNNTSLNTPKGQGHLPTENAIALIGGEAKWDSTTYRNYYLGLLKSIYTGLNHDTLVQLSASGNTGFPPTNENLQQNLIPHEIGFDTENKDFVGLRYFKPEMTRHGARGQINFNLFENFVIKANSGACEYKISSTIPTYNSVALGSESSTTLAHTLNEALMLNNNLAAICSDLGMFTTPYQQKSFEDSYVGATTFHQIPLCDEQGTCILYCCPSVSAGVWLPTSYTYERADGNKFLFYQPIGNEGHTGFHATGQITFDFLESICATFGGGATFYNTISIKDYRLPNHPLQRGIYPFKIDIERKRGETIFAFFSFKAIDFVQMGTFYLDYTFVSQQPDKITCMDANKKRNDAFEAGRKHFEASSGWSSQDIAAGMQFQINDSCQLGFGFKANIRGNRVPKTLTMMADARFIF